MNKVLLPVLVFFLLCNSCIAQIKYPKSFEKHNGKKIAKLYNSIGIDVPKNWFFGPKDPYHFNVTYTPKEFKNRDYTQLCSVHIKPYQLSNNSTELFLSEVSKLRQSYAQGFDDYKVIEESIDEESKQIDITYTYFFKNKPIKGMTRYVHTGQSLYMITYLGGKKQYEMYFNEGMSIVNSFRIKKN